MGISMSACISTSVSARGQADSIAQTSPLTDVETAARNECEAIIARGLTSFVEVGQALAKIRDGKLYRSTHETFEQYVKERWDIGRAHAYRLIGAAETVPVLSPIGDTLPANESQIRPLLQFPVKDRPTVWKEVVRQCNGEITGKDVERIVNCKVKTGQEKVYKARRAAIRAKRRKDDEPIDVEVCTEDFSGIEVANFMAETSTLVARYRRDSSAEDLLSMADHLMELSDSLQAEAKPQADSLFDIGLRTAAAQGRIRGMFKDWPERYRRLIPGIMIELSEEDNGTWSEASA